MNGTLFLKRFTKASSRSAHTEPFDRSNLALKRKAFVFLTLLFQSLVTEHKIAFTVLNFPRVTQKKKEDEDSDPCNCNPCILGTKRFRRLSQLVHFTRIMWI